MIPERLYKYQPVTAQTLQNLKRCTLWFSPPASFNDPFDCALKVVRAENIDFERVWQHLEATTSIDPEFATSMRPDGELSDEFRASTARGIESAFGKIRDQNLNQRGVACLSAKRDNMLMWSHYANGHRGFCLEFDTSCEPFCQAKQVIYSSAVPQLDPVEYLAYDATKPNPLDTMMLTKHECWQYESEWRLVHANANTAYTYDHRLLTGIYFGAAMPEAQMDMIAQLLLGAPTCLYRFRAVDGSFGIEAEPLTYTPFDYGSSPEPHT